MYSEAKQTETSEFRAGRARVEQGSSKVNGTAYAQKISTLR